jgi:hypothetical protein
LSSVGSSHLLTTKDNGFGWLYMLSGSGLVLRSGRRRQHQRDIPVGQPGGQELDSSSVPVAQNNPVVLRHIVPRVGHYVHLHLRHLLRLGALVQATGQVLEQAPLHDGVQAGEAAHLRGALAEAGSELADHRGVGRRGHRRLLPLEVLQVLHGHLEDVGFLQFGMSGGLQRKT